MLRLSAQKGTKANLQATIPHQAVSSVDTATVLCHTCQGSMLVKIHCTANYKTHVTTSLYMSVHPPALDLKQATAITGTGAITVLDAARLQRHCPIAVGIVATLQHQNYTRPLTRPCTPHAPAQFPQLTPPLQALLLHPLLLAQRLLPLLHPCASAHHPSC